MYLITLFLVMHPHQRCFKLLVSGLLTGHICYVYLFLLHNRLYIYILLVPCKSFVILTSYWQRRVSCMRQGMFTLSDAHSTTSHSDINICPFYIIWEVLWANARWYFTSWGTYILIMHAHIFFHYKPKSKTVMSQNNVNVLVGFEPRI